MVDGIGPFAGLIRALSRRRADMTEAAAATSSADTVHGAREQARNAAETPASLRARLRTRLSEVGRSDPDNARRTFVETILLWQLGDDLARDPEFGNLVAAVASQLRSDDRLDGELTKLIAAISA